MSFTQLSFFRTKSFVFAVIAFNLALCGGNVVAATLAGWNVSTQPGGAGNFGASPLAASSSDPNLVIGGLVRGSGVVTSGTGAARGWGGTNWVGATAAAAITANQFVTFSVTANSGSTFSISSIGKLDYRRSATGATTGLIQYQVGSGAFVDAATISYTSSSSSGAAAGPVDLSAISALQSVASGTTVTFRIVNYGASGSGGTWYIYDVGGSTAADLELQGTVNTSGSVAPTLVSSSPVNGATNVSISSTIGLNFSQPVGLTGVWYTLTGSVSGTIAAAVSGSGSSYTISPIAFFSNSETVQLTVLAAQVTNAGGTPMDANVSISFATAAAPSSFTPIHTIQGTGASSAMAGSTVTIEGVVTGDFQGATPSFGGFYVQEQDADADSDPNTSEGIFVFDQGSAGASAVAVGDVVQVSGKVVEFNGLTELNTITLITKTGTAALPAAAVVTLPAATTTALEVYEGMRVTFGQVLTVSDNHLLGQFGELGLSSGGMLRNPTEEIDPNDAVSTGTSSSGTSNVAAVLAALDSNARRFITLDDNSSQSYPDPTPFLDGAQTRRAGDTVTGLTGILSYGFSQYRIYPTQTVVFSSGNPRESSAPTVTGRLKVAGFNVENYFTTYGSRGATNATEFARQQAKVVAALAGVNADVVGLVEVENDGTTALDNLLSALNASVGAGTYARVTESAAGSGTDAIRVAFIYKPAVVTPSGASISQVDSTWSRQPLAQLFIENSTGAGFIACVNHLKSKSATGAAGADLDQGDGQGAYNDRRKQQATLLVSFLNDVKAVTGEDDVIILGDLNAYAQEDPIDILRGAGYADLSLVHSPGGYSYLFDGASGHLDHALASGTLASQIQGLVNWHINSPEPLYYNYNMENKSVAQQGINLGTPYRCSDHDPVIVGINLTPPTVSYASWSGTISWPPGADTTATGDADGDGISNVEELVYGGLPTQRDPSSRPVVSINGDTLSVDYRSRINLAGFAVVPQWSPDMSSWYDILSPTTTGSYNSTTSLKRASISISGMGVSGLGFMRLDIRAQ